MGCESTAGLIPVFCYIFKKAFLEFVIFYMYIFRYRALWIPVSKLKGPPLYNKVYLLTLCFSIIIIIIINIHLDGDRQCEEKYLPQQQDIKARDLNN